MDGKPVDRPQPITEAVADRLRPIQGEIDKIGQLPPNQGGIGFVLEQGGNIGVTGQVYRPLANGWEFGAVGEWTRKQGYAVAGMLGLKWGK